MRGDIWQGDLTGIFDWGMLPGGHRSVAVGWWLCFCQLQRHRKKPRSDLPQFATDTHDIPNKNKHVGKWVIRYSMVYDRCKTLGGLKVEVRSPKKVWKSHNRQSKILKITEDIPSPIMISPTYHYVRAGRIGEGHVVEVNVPLGLSRGLLSLLENSK